MTVQVRLELYRTALERRVENSQAAWDERQGLILSLRDSQGRVARGEAAPLPGYSRDSLDQARRDLSELSAPLLDEIESALAQVEATPSALLAALSEFDERLVPSARFALESAVLGLAAQAVGEPVHRLLRRLVAAWDLPELAPLSLCALVELDLESARTALAAGFSTLKFKVGVLPDPDEELARLRSLRENLGSNFGIRLDANRAWSREAAVRRLSSYRELAVEFVEEPVRPDQLPLTDPPVPLALDESLGSPIAWDARDFDSRGVVALILKPTVLGLFRALQLARQAREHGREPVFSHTFEGPLAFSVIAESALAIGSQRFAHGLAPHAGLAAWKSPASPALDGAWLRPHHRTGLALPIPKPDLKICDISTL